MIIHKNIITKIINKIIDIKYKNDWKENIELLNDEYHHGENHIYGYRHNVQERIHLLQIDIMRHHTYPIIAKQTRSAIADQAELYNILQFMSGIQGLQYSS